MFYEVEREERMGWGRGEGREEEREGREVGGGE